MKEENKSEYKLRRYYNFVNISTLFILPISAVIVYSNKETFLWVTHPTLAFWAFIGIAIWDAIFVFLRAKFHKTIYYDFARYGFVAFFFIGIYATGGVNSTLIVILLFPLLVAAIDLNEKSVRTMGILITILYALLIFVNPEYLHNSSILTRHFLQVFLYGSLVMYVYTLVKETLRQRYEKDEAEKRYIQLIELDKLKSSFVNITSHQLRTPLTGAKWAVETITANNDVSAEENKLLHEAQKKIEMAIDIVSRMLKTAETGQNEFSSKIKDSYRTDIMMREIIDELSFLTNKNKIQITYSGIGQGFVACDKETLKAALTNIVDNAVRYSRSNGEINISVVDMEDKSVITVKDNGIGISGEDQMFLFERFFRGKNAISVDPNESGIGLYISKNIIEFHGGTITLASKLNQGTIVTITLPLKRPSAS